MPVASAQEAVTAFVNVSVVPMDRERVLTGQTVVVRGGTIVAMGPARQVRIPKGAARVDGRGKFLMPGLADMHAHAPGVVALVRSKNEAAQRATTTLSAAEIDAAKHVLFLYVANGVTTVRILGGAPELLTLRAQAARGELVSPRLYVSTPIISDGYSLDVVTRMAGTAKAAGYDFIKIYPLRQDALDSVVAAARRTGIPVVGHAPPAGVESAIRAGYTSIEHLTGFFESLQFVPERPGQATFDTVKLRTLATALQRAGVWNCPTFSHQMPFDAPQPEWRYLADSVRWLAESSFRLFMASRSQGDTSTGHPPFRELLEMLQTTHRLQGPIIRALHAAGAGLLLGTDAFGSEIPGFTVHRELAALVEEAGLTPYEALETGTHNVAAYLGTLDSAGTIAVGKRADLVLLQGNPLTDIHYTARPTGVMIGGRWLSRVELDAGLKAVGGTLPG